MSAIQDIATSTTGRRQSALLRANDTLIRAYSYFGGTSPKPNDPQLMTKQYSKATAPSLLRVETQEDPKSGPEWVTVWQRVIDRNKLEIFWITIYTAILVYLFIDKAYSLYQFIYKQIISIN